MKKISLILTIAIALLLSAFMAGCGADEDEVDDILYESEAEVEISVPDEEEDDVESLYKELVGTYELVKSEVTYVDQPKKVFEPPQVTGKMTISSDQEIIQKYQVLGISAFAKGTFEILIDEGIMVIDNELVDLTSKATYTWDGEILTTTANFGPYVEKDFWRKLNNRVIELQPPEPEPPPPAAAFVSANPPSGSEIAANAVITLTFDNTPADITVTSGVAIVSGRTVTVAGPFTPGHLALTVTWADGSVTLTYIVVAPDVEPPEVTGATVRDGARDVDPEPLNINGIVITFSEEVVGTIALQTEVGDDVGWIGRVDGNKATLELVAGKEIDNETTYVIKGIVSDAAGNQTKISITFLTQ